MSSKCKVCEMLARQREAQEELEKEIYQYPLFDWIDPYEVNNSKRDLEPGTPFSAVNGTFDDECWHLMLLFMRGMI